MSEKLSEWLLDTAILQFGYFVINQKVLPVRFCPEYLPAYPHLLSEVGKKALSKFDVSGVDHLIANFDSIPLGLVCSLQTGLSLVYSQGRGEPAVYDLVGSYNSGHLTTMLVNCVQDTFKIEQFISNARSVGLEIINVVTLLEIQPINQLAGVPVQSVFQLVDIIQALVTNGRLSVGQAQAVQKWVKNG